MNMVDHELLNKYGGGLLGCVELQIIQSFEMQNKKRKQKAAAKKQINDDIKEVKTLLGEAKTIMESASNSQSYQRALSILSRAIPKAQSVQVSNSYHLYYCRGVCYLSLGQLQKAERDLVDSLNLADEKGKILIYSSLGRCKVEMAVQDQSYLEEAVKCYEKALEYSKNTDGQAFLKLANILRRQKNNYEAIKNYTNSLKFIKPSQHYQIYTERGLCYRDVGEVDNSIQDFLKACDINNLNPSCYFNLGINYLLNEKYQLAVQKFQSAIDLNPSEPKYKNYKGMALYLSGQYESCLYAYRETLRLYQQKNVSNDEVGECWYNLGNALYQLNQEDEALVAFRMALRFDLNSDQQLKTYYSEGLVLQAKQDSEAISKFMIALEIMGENSGHSLYLSTLYHLALNQFTHKKYSEAIASISKLTCAGCCDRCVYELKGRIYLADEKYSEALNEFETLRGMDPGYPLVYYYLGMTKISLQDIEGAVSDFFQVVDLGGRNTQLLAGLGLAYLRAGKAEKSLVYINLALEKEPDNEEFLIQRSSTFIELGDNHKGIQDLTKALTINSRNPITYYRRGLSYYKSKQFEQAIGDLQKSLLFSPSQQIEPDIHYHIGLSYAHREQYAEAIEPFSNAIKLRSLAKYYHERAKCRILTEQFKEALEDLNQVIGQQPENAFAYFRLALALKELKRYDEAAENFAKARDLHPEDPKLMVNKKQIYEIKYRKLCEPGEEE